MKAPLPANEVDRLAALYALNVLDTPPEKEFDDIVALAASVCGVPMSLVTLVDADRQWFKATTGTDLTETPRDLSFCAHAILEPGPARGAGRPGGSAVRRPPGGDRRGGVRFYAAAPLVATTGTRSARSAWWTPSRAG